MRRKSAGSLVLFAVVTVVMVLLYLANGSYWTQLLHPSNVDRARIESDAASLESGIHVDAEVVKLDGEPMGETGVQEETTYDGFLTKVTAKYWMLRVGDRLLIVKSAKNPGAKMMGILDAMPYELEMKLFPDGTDPELKARFYPLLLDTDYREPAEVAGFWTLVVEGFCGFFAWRGWRQLSGRAEHPALKRARGWGELSTVSAQVELECQNAVKLRKKSWLLTDNYLVQNSMLRLDVFRLEDLVWAYPKLVRRRFAGVIGIGMHHVAVMEFRDGHAEVNGKKKVVQQLLEMAGTRAPWAMIGYDAELEKLWKTSRSDVVAEVTGRKS